MAERFDFVVVGSGAGGAAAAARLVEGGAKVLLAEKGPAAEVLKRPTAAIARYYTDEGLSAATGNCLLPIPTGTALGGTTKINSGTCLRTPRPHMERWETQSDGRFSVQDFGRHLDDAWRRLKAKPVPRELLNPSTKLVFEGLDRLGIPGAEPLHRAEEGCEGSGRCCFVCPKDAKMSADLAFLSPLKGNPLLEVACETELVDLEEPAPGEPVPLRLRGPRGRRDVLCAAVVLACGTLRTPLFLKKALPWRSAAGEGLSVHPASKVFALFGREIHAHSGVPQDGGLVDPEEPRIRYEGIYVPRALSAMTMPLEGRRLKRWAEGFERLASYGFMIQDSSRGSVRYPFGLPLVRYSMGGDDLALMLRAMKFIARAYFAAGAEAVLLPLNRSDNVLENIEELEKADFSSVRASELNTMAFHPLGTCGAGRVVDWDLRAGEGIYVGDGSVVPESLGVNPQVTISAFALRLAEHLLGGRRAR
jgi:choline dehydrogenase-like flavoprotein